MKKYIMGRSIKYIKFVSFFLTIISLMLTSVSADTVNAETRINQSFYISDNCYESNGNMVFIENNTIHIYDIDISTLDIELIRSYNSHNSNISGPFGKGWTHNYDIRLFENSDNSVTIHYNDGLVFNFTSRGEDNYFLSKGLSWILTKNIDDTFLLSLDDFVYIFDFNGTLIRIIDENGYGVTFTYTDEKLTEIMEDSGISVTLNYNAQNYISSITDSYDRNIFYIYDYLGHLIGVSNSICSTIYAYDSDGNLVDKTDPNGDQTQFVYDSDGNLIRKSDHDVIISADFFVEPNTGNVINQLELNINTLIQHDLYKSNQEINRDIPENIQLTYIFEGHTITHNISLSSNSHNRNIKIDLKRINDFPFEHYTANIFISIDNKIPVNSHFSLRSTNKTITLDAWGQPRIISIVHEGNEIKITMERVNKKASRWLYGIGVGIIFTYLMSFLIIYGKSSFNSDMFAVFNSFSFLFFVALVVAGIKDYIFISIWATIFICFAFGVFVIIIIKRLKSSKENSMLEQDHKMYNNLENMDELIANLKQTDEAMNELNEILKTKLK